MKLVITATFPAIFFLCGCGDDPSATFEKPNDKAPDKTAESSAVLPEIISFNEHIQPILSEYCYHCHGPDSGTREPKKEPLRLDIEADAFKVRESGTPVIIKGKPTESELIRLIKSTDDDEIMPPPKSHKVMNSSEIALIEKWIAQGAVYEGHWSYQSVLRVDPPINDWSNKPIDGFIHEKLSHAGLKPNEPEEPRRFHRRLSFDLTGLPPEPSRTDAFVEAYATNPDSAISEEADRMLETTASAEHFTRYWLDAARYGDTHGIHNDNYRAIWPYRDWVIRAFLTNMPWDQFTTEQIAGDLLPQPSLDQRIATGFLRCLPTTGEGGAIPDEYNAIYATDRVDTMGALWLGLTASCASCHDHKFDPFSTREFYQLTAFFRNNTMSALDGNDANHPPSIFAPLMDDRERWSQLQTKLSDVNKRIAERNQLLEDEKIMRDRGSMTLVYEEKKEAPFAHVLTRGSYTAIGEKVFPETPAMLPPMPEGAPKDRRGLAMWLNDPKNPLPARVTMNRLWYYMFGKGIVETNGDFGIMGARPTHPKLLDWLASEFIASKWNFRHMAKTIVMSETYRQAGHISPEKLEADPSNKLLARGPRTRLDAEQIRDLALASSNLLSTRVGGPSVKPYQPEGVWSSIAMPTSNTKDYKQDTGDALYRRSVYTFWKRIAAPPTMEILNAPTREIFCVARERTNTPLQALALMNDTQFVEAARALATHALKEGKDFDQRIDMMSLRLLNRKLDNDERTVIKETYIQAEKFYRENPNEAKLALTVGVFAHDQTLPTADLAAWSLIANQLFNLDETVTR